MGMKEKKTLNSVLFHVVTCAIGLIMIYPLLWLFASSMKSNATMFKDAYSLIPEQFDLVTNYKSALAGVGGVSFWTFLGNTVIVTVVGVIGCVMVSLFAAYAFTRIKFKGSNFWFSCVMITMMIPSQVSFDTQDNLLEFHPTAYHLNFDEIMELGEKFIKLKTEEKKIFYVWGHSYELDYHDSWSDIERFCKMMSGYDDICYATNKEALLG